MANRVNRPLGIFALAGFVAVAAAAPSSSWAQGQWTAGQLSASSQMPDIVPFEYDSNGLIIIKALVGDGLVGPAVIDTGLPTCLATPNYATKHGMKSAGVKSVDVLDRSVSVLDASAQALRINRVLVTAVPFGVFDIYGHLSATPPKDGPELWIGNSALAALSMTIDPQTLRITFRPSGAAFANGSTVIPFDLKDGRIWMDVKVNGKKSFSALVTTGSVGTLLPASVAKALTLVPTTTLTMTHPDGKEGKACAVELTDITLGTMKVPDVQALYIDKGSKDGFDTDFGIIGNDVLMRYRVTIDYGQKKMAFEKLLSDKSVTPGANNVIRPGIRPGLPGTSPINQPVRGLPSAPGKG